MTAVARTPAGSESTIVIGAALLLAVTFFAWTARPLRRAYRDPGPATIGPLIGACVLGLVPLNAAFAAPSGVEWATLAVVWFVPAVVLSRLFDVS